jgi:hypothetical protein
VVGPNLLKPHINFILCFGINNLIKVNINKTIATYFSRKTRVYFISMTYMNVVQPVITILETKKYLSVRNFILIIIFIPHSWNPLSSVV